MSSTSDDKKEEILKGLHNNRGVERYKDNAYRIKNSHLERQVKKLEKKRESENEQEEKKRELENEQKEKNKSMLSRVTRWVTGKKRPSNTGGRKKKHRITHKKKRSKKSN